MFLLVLFLLILLLLLLLLSLFLLLSLLSLLLLRVLFIRKVKSLVACKISVPSPLIDFVTSKKLLIIISSFYFPDVTTLMKLTALVWFPVVRNSKGVAVWQESDRLRFPRGKSERRFVLHKVYLSIITTVKI